jgi:hypothetical protein
VRYKQSSIKYKEDSPKEAVSGEGRKLVDRCAASMTAKETAYIRSMEWLAAGKPQFRRAEIC